MATERDVDGKADANKDLLMDRRQQSGLRVLAEIHAAALPGGSSREQKELQRISQGSKVFGRF